MAVLEAAITFQGDTLVQRVFYDAKDVLDPSIRNSLLQAISGLASEAFNDELRAFTLGEHAITMVKEEIAEPNDPNKKYPLYMYAIIEKDTDIDTVRECMKDALQQFLNRFSVNHIIQKKIKKFAKFASRLDDIFQDLRLKTEDRFKSLF